ncbi:hypothetical protein ACC778_08290 [Rhizobium ruizarguesonis]
MKSIVIPAAILAALIAGSTSANVNVTASPRPAVFVADEHGANEQGGQKGFWFYGHTLNIRYSPSDGDQVLWRMHGFKDIELVGLPPFLREVFTIDGRLLRGVAQPGDYTVEMHTNGVRGPLLDMNFRFIPQ